MARDRIVTDPQSARSLGRASYIVSSAGIAVTVIIIVVYLGVYFGTLQYCNYSYNGRCYLHMSCSYTYAECSAVGGVYDGNCCYYN